MKHAIIAAHPNSGSFTMTVARAYADAVTARGHDALLRDLYAMHFNPCLGAGEIPDPKGFSPASDVLEERRLIGDANVFAFVYPFWFNAPPAIFKGYIDRVFGMGFAYGAGHGGNTPLLTGRKMISLTSSGAPTHWVISSGAWDATQALFDRHIAGVCGLTSLGHLHIGNIVPGIRPDVVEDHIQKIQGFVEQHF